MAEVVKQTGSQTLVKVYLLDSPLIPPCTQRGNGTEADVRPVRGSKSARKRLNISKKSLNIDVRDRKIPSDLQI